MDERALEREHGGSPESLARHLARAKALAVSAHHPKHYVLGCDQILCLDGTIFHKPETMQDAAAQLQQFAGKTHRLISAFSLVARGDVIAEESSEARLSMRKMSGDFIAAYLDAIGDAALQCVGAYQIEGTGMHLFETVEGDHSTILGLPLLKLLAALRRLDLMIG